MKKIEVRKTGKIRSFEDLDVYRIAREFGREVEKLIQKLPSDEKRNGTINLDSDISGFAAL